MLWPLAYKSCFVRTNSWCGSCQPEQMRSFSPVWSRLCWARSRFHWKPLPHSSHLNIVASWRSFCKSSGQPVLALLSLTSWQNVRRWEMAREFFQLEASDWIFWNWPRKWSWSCKKIISNRLKAFSAGYFFPIHALVSAKLIFTPHSHRWYG